MSEKELQHGVNKLIIFVANKNPHARWISISFLFYSSNVWFVISIYGNQKSFAIGLSPFGVALWSLWYLWLKILLFKWFSFLFLESN